MTDEQTDAAREHAEDMASKVPGLLEGLAEKIGANAGAKAVFGEPVREGERTVIPVAQAIVGTGAGGGGGGGGSQDDAAGAGLGAGGGALTRPLGYIEVTAESAEFVPLRRPWADPKLVLAYATIVLIVSRALVKLIRG